MTLYLTVRLLSLQGSNLSCVPAAFIDSRRVDISNCSAFYFLLDRVLIFNFVICRTGNQKSEVKSSVPKKLSNSVALRHKPNEPGTKVSNWKERKSEVVNISGIIFDLKGKQLRQIYFSSFCFEQWCSIGDYRGILKVHFQSSISQAYFMEHSGMSKNLCQINKKIPLSNMIRNSWVKQN